MIITGLSARNVLKYAQLDLKDFPTRGLIAVEGANESGKSSVGEMICFVLFGRTYSLEEGELNHLIMWGELSCSITLQFIAGDQIEYEITRFLDQDGNQSARLNRVGLEHQPMARGAEQVQSALNALIGYNYEEFIESFYLAQREITTPHPHSHAVKAMAGLAVLERLSEKYGDEISVEEQMTVDARKQADVLEDELTELNIEPGKLESQIAEQQILRATEDSLQQQLHQLGEACDSYLELLPAYRNAVLEHSRYRFLRTLTLLLTLLLAASWGMFVVAPEHALTLWLQNLLGERQQWFLYGAVLSAGMFLLFWWLTSDREGKIQSIRAACRSSSEPINLLDLGAVSENPKGADSAPKGKLQPGDTGKSDRVDKEDPSGIFPRVLEFEVDGDELSAAVDERAGQTKKVLAGYRQQIDQMSQEIERERQRVERAKGLAHAGEEVQKRIAEHEKRIAMRYLAQDLLVGATRHFSQVFNRNLRELVGRTLPLLTEQRYQYLHIDEDLSVTVFSKEKRDFVVLEELSSGTQRQIMLALRLALSQELVNKAVQGTQFLFLDEPFAFFDQERTRNALSVLPKLSNEITQIWVVAQEFPPAFPFDRIISCNRDQPTLRMANEAPESQ